MAMASSLISYITGTQRGRISALLGPCQKSHVTQAQLGTGSISESAFWHRSVALVAEIVLSSPKFKPCVFMVDLPNLNRAKRDHTFT